jgi:hypothetical protein
MNLLVDPSALLEESARVAGGLGGGSGGVIYDFERVVEPEAERQNSSEPLMPPKDGTSRGVFAPFLFLLLFRGEHWRAVVRSAELDNEYLLFRVFFRWFYIAFAVRSRC